MKREQVGRDSRGRFVAGNGFGRGNSSAKRAWQFRNALLEEITNEDIRRIVRRLIDSAVGGDVQAAKTIFERVMGPCVSFDLLEKIEELEEVLQKLGG